MRKGERSERRDLSSPITFYPNRERRLPWPAALSVPLLEKTRIFCVVISASASGGRTGGKTAAAVKLIMIYQRSKGIGAARRGTATTRVNTQTQTQGNRQQPHLRNLDKSVAHISEERTKRANRGETAKNVKLNPPRSSRPFIFLQLP